MYTSCIAVVDSSRARLFMLERSAEPAGLRDEMTEVADLLSPGRRLRPSELFASSGLSSGHAGRGGTAGYAFDDHRDAHIAGIDAGFAQAIVDALTPFAARARHLVVCASAHMLGQLRPITRALRRPDLTVNELPSDIVQLTPPEIRAHLVEDGLLPPPAPRPGAPTR
jgi:protein required for attachment to host cells